MASQPINQADPTNATALEMFALCNYADDKNTGTGGTFGSWQTLKVYDINGSCNGFEETNTIQTFHKTKKIGLGCVLK